MSSGTIRMVGFIVISAICLFTHPTLGIIGVYVASIRILYCVSHSSNRGAVTTFATEGMRIVWPPDFTDIFNSV
jgi:hypothetical protein